MKVDKKSGLITGAVTALVGGGVALGLVLAGNGSSSPDPAPVKVADVTGAPVSSTAPTVSPSNVGVKPAANNVAPIQSPKVANEVTDPTSDAPAPEPSDSSNPNVVTSAQNGPGVSAPPPPSGQFVPGTIEKGVPAVPPPSPSN
jgi:hypothetical protein